ncbi:MAG: VTT domain-containing protein [Alphaproteobacteria bacterium]|jgi:uncharacterized membrane protein YdjX (TVP38/TMEM64 family)
MTEPIPDPWLRRLPILVIAIFAGIGLIYFRQFLRFEVLGQNRDWLIGLRDAHYLLTALAFMVIYILVVLTSLPGGLIMSLTGGFLFGLFPGVIFNVTSATVGAVLLFLAIRSGFSQDVAARIAARGGAVARLQSNLKQNEIWVMLTMRLIPVLPFSISNILPALVGVRLWAFAMTTILGIIPACLIYASIGSDLSDIFDRGEAPRLTDMIGLPLAGLAALSALPLVIKYVQSRKT